MTLHEFNTMSQPQLVEQLTRCCGSSTWVTRMLQFIPADDLVELLEDAEEQWWGCNENDWKEAFSHHPKIGDAASLQAKFASTAAWAAGEQKTVANASAAIIEALAAANKDYEQRFGFIFIVCATGKSAEEMLALLQQRIKNEPADEIQVAAEEQIKITKLRLEKLLQ